MPDAYRASRWTSGNRIFPATLQVAPDGVHFEQRRLLGGRQEMINYRHISSVRITSGILFADLLIETSGGSDSIAVHGLWKRDANAIRDAIQRMQGGAAERG